jgi:hypothetical protein
MDENVAATIPRDSLTMVMSRAIRRRTAPIPNIYETRRRGNHDPGALDTRDGELTNANW